MSPIIPPNPAREPAPLLHGTSVELALKMLAVTLFVLVVGLPSARYLVGFPILVLLFAALIHPATLRSPGFWLLAAFILSIAIFSDPLGCANHYYLITYVCLAAGLSHLPSDEEPSVSLGRSARWIFVLLMAFAALQKALSPSFRDGSFLYLRLLRGGVFSSYVSPLGGALDRVTARNHAAIQDFFARDPRLGAEIVLQEIPGITGRHLQTASFAVILAELVLVVVFLVPRFRLARHLALLAFLISVFLTREEGVFLSTVAILGLAQCPGDLGKIRLFYVLAILVFLGFKLLGILNPL